MSSCFDFKCCFSSSKSKESEKVEAPPVKKERTSTISSMSTLASSPIRIQQFVVNTPPKPQEGDSDFLGMTFGSTQSTMSSNYSVSTQFGYRECEYIAKIVELSRQRVGTEEGAWADALDRGFTYKPIR